MSVEDEASSSHHSGPGNNTVYGRTGYTNGFPLSYACGSTESIQTIYAQSLLHTGNGLALLSPQGLYHEDNELQRKTGVVIGDVGFLAKNGVFNVLFNIYKPRNSNPSLLPRQYESIKPPLAEWEVRTVPDHFAPATVLTSKGVHLVDPESPSEYQFTCPYSRAGVLILPDGGSRTDLVDVDRLQPYIEQHALDWYRFANDYDYNGIFNGALHLVTGADHASKWATAAVSADEDFSSEVQFEYERETNTWSPSTYLEPGSLSDDDPEQPQTGTVFVRTFCIGLGSALWSRYAPSLSPSKEPRFTLLTRPSTAKAHQPRWRILNVLSNRQKQPKPIPDDLMDPSALILQVMLFKTPSANVVIVHSSIWDPFTGHDFDYPEIFDHIVSIFKNYSVTIKGGLSVLLPNTDDDSKPPAVWKMLVKRALSTFTPPQAWLVRRERAQLWKAIYRVPEQEQGRR